jgi:hypothetical protein
LTHKLVLDAKKFQGANGAACIVQLAQSNNDQGEFVLGLKRTSIFSPTNGPPHSFGRKSSADCNVM